MFGCKAKTALLLLCMSTVAMAQNDNNEYYQQGWYGGASVGVPFSKSTMSSFGKDKLHAGWDAGVYGGYRFNRAISLEMFGKWGQTNQGVNDHIYKKDLWWDVHGELNYGQLMQDKGRYYGVSLNDMTTRVFVQSYGVQFNLNLLGFSEATKYSRWRLELSPFASATVTKSKIKTDESKYLRPITHWNAHFRLGSNLQATYAITKRLDVGLYTGFAHLFNDKIDATPDKVTDANFIWETGVRVGWTFGKFHKKSKKCVAPVATEEPEPIAERTPEKPVKVEEVVKVETEGLDENQVIEFPIIYFEYDKVNVRECENDKMNQIVQILSDNPNVKVTLNGWCDKIGPKAVNDRKSLQRADNVKKWLVNKGINADRLNTIGHGSDMNEAVNEKARKVEIEENK